ncbi:DNA translocase FtsK [Virgibacillus sp. W0181]|uniref:DNA translocase FtsK n=1 Tax=Virgibacillus sp. W0181 TaxID=3391581 RepID=UPI003F478D78
MWNRWKRKLRALFSDRSDQEDDVDVYYQQDKVHTRMMYQYPKQTSFRFPVIPDEPNAQHTTDTHAVKRTSENNPEKDTMKSSHTHVYQQRPKDIENIPAFLRRQKHEETGFKKDEAVEHTTEQETPTDHDGASIINHVLQTDAATKRINERKMKRSLSTNEKHEDIKTKQHETPVKRESVYSLETKRKNNTPIHTEPTVHVNSVTMKSTAITAPIETGQAVTETSTSQKQMPALSIYPQVRTPVKDQPIPNNLLNEPAQVNDDDQIWLEDQQQLLERTLKYFHVRAKVVNTTKGPSVVRFEVQPELGVKVSKIKNLSDDIKLNMAAKDIRIEAPIPGKHTIGIEVPNPKPEMVGLQEIVSSNEFKNHQSPLSTILGVTIEGESLITDIAKMPHGLIAGATGSGKSVCINTILISLLYKARHDEVKFLLIDPKMVELAPYNGIPHLAAPVITDAKAATQALKWAVKEMENRYERFVKAGVRDMERFNKKVSLGQLSEEKMPYIIIVIDELADLMMVAPQDVEDAICRIAQKARACGIHLLLATQRPSVDVITGLIKANIPTRIAFSVSSQVDSRTILDANGAEKLLGKGDMLFIENGSGKSIRLQGPFVSDEEIERVTDYFRTVSSPEYLFEQEELLKDFSLDETEDELLETVIQFIAEQEHASTSLLQRHFRIGYNRAARLIDTLENKGVIAAQNGTKPREILLTKTQIEESML